MALEIEKKFLDPDFDLVRERLHKCNAVYSGRHFEENYILDLPDSSLTQSHRLLRLRRNIWPGHIRAILTCKLPLKESEGNFKIREEYETGVENMEEMRNILNALGYRQIVTYEKLRESWAMILPSITAPIKIELDLLPFCKAIEVEGEQNAIDMAASLLGLDKLKISTKSYHELHQEWRLRNRFPACLDMVFEKARKDAIMRELNNIKP